MTSPSFAVIEILEWTWGILIISIPAYSGWERLSKMLQDKPWGLCLTVRSKKLQEKPLDIKFNSQEVWEKMRKNSLSWTQTKNWNLTKLWSLEIWKHCIWLHLLWYFMLNIMQECQIKLSATLSPSHNEENHSCLIKDKSKSKQDAQKILRNPSAQNSWENSGVNLLWNSRNKKFLRSLLGNLLQKLSTSKFLRKLLRKVLSKSHC